MHKTRLDISPFCIRDMCANMQARMSEKAHERTNKQTSVNVYERKRTTQTRRTTRMNNSHAHTIRLFGTENDTIVDGPGLRFGVFVQGCSHKCKGCHNPESWSANAGVERTIDDVLREIHENALVHAVTLSGGEPFEQTCACAELACALRREGYNVWCYTGYLYEDLINRATRDECVKKLLENIDVLVDGPYIEKLNSYDISWRGSSNQRVIDIPKSMRAHEVILWKEPSYNLKKPDNW